MGERIREPLTGFGNFLDDIVIVDGRYVSFADEGFL